MRGADENAPGRRQPAGGDVLVSWAEGLASRREAVRSRGRLSLSLPFLRAYWYDGAYCPPSRRRVTPLPQRDRPSPRDPAAQR